MRNTITSSMFFIFMGSLIILVSGQGMVYSGSESPKCPNAGSGPPNPPCPGGGCPPSGGPTPGGDLGCPPSGGIGDMTTNDSYVGDPINISTASVTKTVIDASIPVKYGGLGVSRIYSSEVFDTKNSDGETMFGPHWHGNYEYRLTEGDYNSGYTDYHFLDSDGSHYDFYYAYSETDATGGNVAVYRSHIVQGPPMELRYFVSNEMFVLTRSDHSEIYFETYQGEYRVIALEGNRDTFAQERINFTYDTLGRLSEVHANGDDRYLEFSYEATSLQVDQVSLVTASSSVALAEYGYSSTLLTTFKRPESGVGSYQIIYEYGSFDGTNLNSISGQPYILGRVSYELNGRLFYLNAYEYEDRTVGGVFKPHMAVASYHDAGDEDWVKVVEVNYVDWYNVETIYPCNATNKPKSLDTLDWQHDLLTRSYENLGTYQYPAVSDPDFVPMPVSSTSVASKKLKVPSTSMSVYTPGWAVARPRIRTGAALYDTVAGTFSINVMENQFTFADPDPFLNTDANYLYQFYKSSSTNYSTTDSSSAVTTSYQYNTTFPYLIDTITYHDGGEVSYTYGTNLSVTNEYARVTSSLDLENHPTYYTYYSNGLLESITDHHNNVTTYQYNSRGQMNRVLLPNGGIISKTYNDFGQVLTSLDEKTGKTTTYQYSDQLVSTDPQYHIPPRLVKVTNHLGKETKFEYNAWGQTTKTIDPNNVETSNGYDARGNLVTSVNGEGDIVKYRYDIFDRLVKYLDGNFSTLPEVDQRYTEYYRDVFGRIVAEKDPSGKVTSFEFTGDNCSSCNSGSSPSLVSHIARPQKEPTDTVDKEHVFFKYDLMGRPTFVDYSNEAMAPSDWNDAEISFTYNDMGQIETVTDSRLLNVLDGDQTYHYSYEAETGKLLQITHPEGYTQDYIYDSISGDLVAYRDIDGRVTKYVYDSYDRLYTLTDPYADDTKWTYYDFNQSTYPIGALQKVERSNFTWDEYKYDSLGRLDRINYRMSEYSQVTLHYVDLDYDDAGMITDKDMGGTYSVEYDYDDAYRLTEEIYNNSSDVEQFRRSYTYDDAGNRASMTFGSKITTYAYGDRNEMTSNTGYARFGSVDTGPMTFQYDDRGNMKYQSGINNTWNEDDRLTKVNVSGGDPKGGAHVVNYRYDSGGCRLLKDVDDGQRTRYFFKNLTEETKKVSIATHNDTAFGFTSKLDAEGSDGGVNQFGTPSYMSISYDNDRFSNVYSCSNWTASGRGWWDSADDGWNLSGKRTVSFWAKTNTTNTEVAIHVKCTDGTKIGLYYKPGSGTDYKHASNPQAYYYQPSTARNYLNSWARIERDLQADIDKFWTGKTLSKVTGLSIGIVSIDDLRFSNSMTVEHNVLGPGSIGHILRHCTFSTTTHARTDHWYHYDQVGSVVCESTSSAIPSMYQRYADSFGNRLSSWQTGEWTSTWASRDGWGHNTKEVDGDTGNLYMYQRWYQPELGVFMSVAPKEPYLESQYGFAMQSPTISFDPNGMIPQGEGAAMLRGLCYATCMGLMKAAKKATGVGSVPNPCDSTKFPKGILGKFLEKACNKLWGKISGKIDEAPDKVCKEACGGCNALTNYADRAEICGAYRECESKEQKRGSNANLAKCEALRKLCDEARGAQ